MTLNKDSSEKDKQAGGLGKEYAFRWSNSKGELLTTIVPMLYGGASGEELGEDSHFGYSFS